MFQANWLLDTTSPLADFHLILFVKRDFLNDRRRI